jgi:hypothetical protein
MREVSHVTATQSLKVDVGRVPTHAVIMSAARVEASTDAVVVTTDPVEASTDPVVI